MLTLYQAEWCPFSSAVREVLTELGIDFVARQVEPWPEDRENLRKLSGNDQIPALETENGRFIHGTRKIFGYLSDREPWEHAICALPGARLVPFPELPARLDELEREREVVVYCHHGIRSAIAVEWLRQLGVPAVNLRGGIDAWALQVDPTLPRY